MKKEIKNTWNDFILLIFRVFMDALALVVILFIAKGLKYVLEKWIFNKSLSEIDNVAVSIVYDLVEYLALIMFFLFIGLHLFEQIKKILKDLRG